MRSRTLLIGLAAGLAAVAVSGLAGGTAGGAAKKASKHCPDGAVCLWSDNSFEGDKFVVRTKALSNEIYDEGFNDQASSLKSSRGKVSFMYTGVDGGGIEMCVLPHLKAPALSLYGGMDNSISSSKLSKRKHCHDA